MSVRRAVGTARIILDTQFNFENAKTALFFYVILSQTWKASRHLVARGVTQTIREFYRYVSQVR